MQNICKEHKVHFYVVNELYCFEIEYIIRVRILASMCI